VADYEVSINLTHDQLKAKLNQL